jgi:TolB-like protein/predicted Zn-dependent protease
MGLIAEAQRRRVFRVAAAYLVVGWLVIQVAATVLPQFDLPAWAPRLVTLLVALGFPIALVMAWVFDVTPEGIKVDASAPGSKRLLGVSAALVALAMAWYFHDRPDAHPAAPAGPVSRVATTLAEAQQAIPSIAVLPFVDMSQAGDQAYFSDGLSEELLNLLAQLPQMRVISRTSSFSFKGKEVDVATIAKALNVANVLEGSVRKSGNTLRITAQLIRASDSSHLWSQTYDRQLTDVFKVQDDIAAAVVAALKVKLLPAQSFANRPRSRNPEAYDQYLIGNQFNDRANQEGWRRATAAYRRSIALDPEFAPAYAALAASIGALADVQGDPAGMAQSEQNAEMAIRLAPNIPDGYVSRSYVRMAYRRDWRGAETDLDKALALAPNDGAVQLAHARMLIVLNRLPEAITAARKSTDVDPLWPPAWADLGRYLNANRQFPAARQALNRALEISPESSYALYHLGETALLEGKPQEALETFRKAEPGYGLAGIAMAQHALGHEEESQQAMDEEIARNGSSAGFQIAEAFAWRGDKDKAFQWLDRAYAQHDGGLAFIKSDPLLANLYNDPRFRTIVTKLGLPD